MKKWHFLSIFVGTVFVLFLFILSLSFDKENLTRLSFYLDLANPTVKVVKLYPGLRKEEIAEVLGKKLAWTEENKKQFIDLNQTENQEGKYFPKTYLIDKNKNPEEIGELMLGEYEKQLDKIIKTKKVEILNEETALKIASLIQREAAGKHDMALISGIIWNRIWAGMKLQIDATLQYAKGNEEEGWWQLVYPEDKKIKSEYNTYLNKGLPPAPISNPGRDAIYAAFNPTKTDCIFYLHDKNKKIHCSKTYKEHKEKIKIYY